MTFSVEHAELIIYKDIPALNVRLDYLEEVASRRLKLYSTLDAYPKSDLKALHKHLRHHNYVSYSILMGSPLQEGESLEAAKTEDAISHFLLRLKFCQSKQPRAWFLKHEWLWFRVRYSTVSDVPAFLSNNNIIIKCFEPDTERHRLLGVSLMECGGVSLNDFLFGRIYQLPFQEIPLLVRMRKCILEKGQAFFIEKHMPYYLKFWFVKEIQHALVNMGCVGLEDQRIRILLSKFNVNVNLPLCRSISHPVDSKRVEVDLKETWSVSRLLDRYAHFHYPLCMKVLHELLRETSHLKYFARMQYGLFIKEMGIPYEQAMAFWEEAFTNKFPEDVYKRKYSYLFKHQYGMVGSKREGRGYKCETIIQKRLSPLDQHGCPFRHYDRDNLKRKLRGLGVSRFRITEVLDLVSTKQYRHACALYFEITHEVRPFEAVRHPNEYFMSSITRNCNCKNRMHQDIPDIEDIFGQNTSDTDDEN